MGYKTAYRELIREYEADRDRAQALLAAKREELYRLNPRLREIDAELKNIGLSLARLSLADDNGEALVSIRTVSQTLQEEKASLIPESYYTDVYRCVHCRDTGFIEHANGLPERCVCLKQRLIEKYYDLSNLHGILEEENFDTFNLQYYGKSKKESEGLSPHTNMQMIFNTAKQFAMHFGKVFNNLLLCGETGLGKTFVSNCIARELLNNGQTVLYMTAPRLFKIIEDYRFNRNEMDEPDEMLEAVTEVDLLIIDDLGAEFSTVVTSAALFDIINQRLLTKKPMVISTNLSPMELDDQYSDRIVSRFLGYFKVLKFFGDDIRIKKKYVNKKPT
jgi:DNA replication protein DnaC